MRDGAVSVDLYNAKVTGGVSVTLRLGSSDADHVPCVIAPMGVSFDANMGFPLIADCSHTIYHGTCPGHKNRVIVTL